MPLFSFNRNSDGGSIGEWYYGEMPPGKALSDAPIPTIIQQDEGQTSSLAASKSIYENLPHHLKSCFDYINILSRHFNLKKGKVVRHLLAQGLIPEKPGEIMEDTAANIIQELIGLGMLQEYYSSSRILLSISEFHEKSCLIEVEEHDFVAKIANLPIHASIGNDGKDLPRNFNALPIRSFFGKALTLASCHLYKLIDFSQVYLQSVCALQFILVLDLWGDIDYLPDEVGDLVHLTYLGLRSTRIKKLPHTIGNLQKLQTLEVESINLHQLPIEIQNIIQLRHLLLNNYSSYAEIRVPRGIGKLVNLHTCAGVHVDAGFASELSTLTHLRNLDVKIECDNDHASELFAAIFKLENLVSLSLSSENPYLGTPLPELESFSPPPHLQELSLCGGLFEIPNWLASTENLTSLELCHSNLLENPSSILQFLPKLKHLFLRKAYKAKIIGKEFCEAGGYPQLETLSISSEDLVEWTEIVNGAFPSLKSLKFEFCSNLRFFPEGLQHISTIQELILLKSHGDLERKLRGVENYKIKHISKLFIN